ncbi:MAG: thioesterase family protein [Eubacterium sp.]|nr:thioesterase family protein [Eubacterium sp.]
METGIKNRMEITVTKEITAKAMGSGELPVLATPAMVALIEEACWRSVADELNDGQGTVGTLLDIKHLSATPVGMRVACESELIGVEGRKLTFVVSVYDEAGLIGEGTHERFIVDNERFLAKAETKSRVE